MIAPEHTITATQVLRDGLMAHHDHPFTGKDHK